MKGLTPKSQNPDIIDVTAPTITRVTHRVAELFYIDFDELCLPNLLKLFTEIKF